MHAFCVILRYHFNCKTIYHKTLNFMIYSIPKYINNLKSQKIKFVKLNIHVPYLDAKFTTAKNSSYMYMYGYC